jgi:hypothetical protein
MGKYVEDARVVTFAADTLIAHDTYLNEQQDQLRGVLKARRLDVTPLFIPKSGDTWVYQYTGAAGLDWYWVCSSASQRMQAVLPLREGEKIVDIDVIYQDSSTAGGEIALYSKQRIAVGSAAALNASVHVADLDVLPVGDPWNQGGANYYRVRTAVNVVVAADYQYSIWVQSSTNAGGDTFIAAIVNPQFGN